MSDRRGEIVLTAPPGHHGSELPRTIHTINWGGSQRASVIDIEPHLLVVAYLVPQRACGIKLIGEIANRHSQMRWGGICMRVRHQARMSVGALIDLGRSAQLADDRPASRTAAPLFVVHAPARNCSSITPMEVRVPATTATSRLE